MASIVQRVTDVAARVALTSATVSAVTDHDRFRMIELTGEKLIGETWVAGDKLRVRCGDGFSLRTYTPMSWDTAKGTTRILAYIHGDGPGARWSRDAQPGDSCRLLGPDHSIRLDRVDAPPVFVGDETAFGLLVALRATRPEMTPVVAALEVTDERSSADTLHAYDIDDARLVVRSAGDAHLDAYAGTVLDAVRSNAGAPLILSGRAQTIAAVRKRLKREGVAAPATTVKAYWDVNRKGLD